MGPRTLPRWTRLGAVVGCAVLLTCSVAAVAPHAAAADREHTVRSGQTLSGIARRYGVPVSSLAAANNLRRSSTLRPGQVLRVPEEGVTYVRSGQTLSAIARAHDCSVGELMRLNRLRENSTLRVGQRLVLPGFRAAQRREAAADRWGRPRHPGVATLVRIYPRERQRVRLVNSRRQPTRAARRVLRRFMQDGPHGGSHYPHPRLIKVLAEISDHFGGRPLVIVSGYREAGGYTRESSRHTSGRAVDMRVQGVSNRHLRNYCRKIPRVGCGYYPHSTFVHIDVRARSGYWVDWSRPGEAPRYRRPPRDQREEPGDDDEQGTPEDEAAVASADGAESRSDDGAGNGSSESGEAGAVARTESRSQGPERELPPEESDEVDEEAAAGADED